MDLTTWMDWLLSVITKSQVESLFIRLGLNITSDFHVFIVWLFLSIVIDLVVLIGVLKLVKMAIRNILGRVYL